MKQNNEQKKNILDQVNW